MSNVKILQIIPAPAGMRAVHEFDGKPYEVPVVALALAVEPETSRYVVALEMCGDGGILIAENEPGFLFILSAGDHLEQKEDKPND